MKMPVYQAALQLRKLSRINMHQLSLAAKSLQLLKLKRRKTVAPTK